jgi:hypothetical protein
MLTVLKGSQISGNFFGTFAERGNHEYTVRPSSGLNPSNMPITPCRGGGTGRRAGFKIRFLRKCGFDSRSRHHNNDAGSSPFSYIFHSSKTTRYPSAHLPRSEMWLATAQRAVFRSLRLNVCSSRYQPLECLHLGRHDRLLPANSGRSVYAC